MILLIGFAFLAGIITVLSPCILPVLPIILSSTSGEGKKRPLGVIIGFIASFTFFTLFLSSLVKLTGISADSLRLLSVIVLIVFGLTMITPQAQKLFEQLFARLSRFTPQTQNKTGFGGGLVIGLSLGLLWTPCVGPILASVISLAITGSVNTTALFITLAYSLGTAIPLFAIMQGGRQLLTKNPWLLENTGKIQKLFGILMILTAIGIIFNIDRKFQTFILNTFPGYGVGLTRLEENDAVKKQLEQINTQKIEMGKPMFELTNQKGIPAPELIVGGVWFGSTPLTIESLKGKVVLIDFWTYSCINCQRTFPYLKNWYQKYRDKRLIVIGVHSPEFEFEKSAKNVEKALLDFDITYPVMQDNNFETWRAYSNRYWPAKYLIDKQGNIRYTHFGEGKYDETEKVIQELLSENGEKIAEEISNPDYNIYAKTPETYLGYERIERFASPEIIVRNKDLLYSVPNQLRQNHVALGGVWNVGAEFAMPKKGSYLKFSFEAKDVYLVMRPKNESQKAQVKVLLDDQEQQVITIDYDGLYELLKLEAPGKHILKLEFLDENVEVYAFTFG